MLFKRLCILVLLLSTTGLYAMTQAEKDFYTVDRVELVEIKTDPFNQHVEKSIDIFKVDQEAPGPDPIENAGRIISVARDLVALGEEIYSIVTHGKPNITTKYDPISVVPKEGGQPVDPMDMEQWAMPTKRTFSLNYKNKLGMTVVDFQFHVMWSYGGSYNGRGAYITGAQIIPAAAVKWGFDFTATMKLGGIQNSGRKDNPIATASLILEHTVSNILNARTISHIFVIDGKGRFKRM